MFDPFCFNSLQRELYLAANPTNGGSDGEVCIISTTTGNKNYITGEKSDNKANFSLDNTKAQEKSQGQKKRERHG
jgi:hypothetical protein